MTRPTLKIHAHVARTPQTGVWPSALDRVLSPAMADAALTEISGWPGYAPTPMHRLNVLARRLDLADIAFKDEGQRFGLGSFKALGGAYAVLQLAADHIAAQTGEKPSLEKIRDGAFSETLAPLTVTAATAGNHGLSVAWGAQMAGCRCRIYIHAGVSDTRRDALAARGAEVVRVDGDYDASVRRCADESAAHDWFVVSDTSYDGYMEIPRDVMAGYTVMASEALDQLSGAQTDRVRLTHVFIPAGVGGMAAAVLARFWQALGPDRPRFVIVEPTRAACVIETARRDEPTTVELTGETVMAGLSCGTVSLLAWDILQAGAAHYVTVDDDPVGPAMRLLNTGKAGGGSIVAGESAVAGLIGLIAAATDPALRDALQLDQDSRVLLFGCEGATDPAIYRALVDGSADLDIAGP